MDTRRLLALRIDDILFGDSDKWVERIENVDYVPNDVARTTSTAKNRHLNDEIGDSLRAYKTERMRYVGIRNDYRRRLHDLQMHEQQKSETPTLESVANEGEPNSIFAALAKMADETPQRNVDLGAEYLEEGRIRKFLAARTFLDWIYKALGSGALIPGQGLESKLSDCNKQRTDLETDFQDLTQEHTLLEADYSRLEWEYNVLYFQQHVRPTGR